MTTILNILLPNATANFKDEAPTDSIAAPLIRKVEPVGRAYESTKHPPVEQEAEADEQNAQQVQLKDAKYEKLKDKSIDLNDYYSLLGLEDKMFDATEDEIRKTYRVVSQVLHPDKALPADRQYAEERFKALQVGFETLTDPARRRAYDSSLEFDDRVPKDKEGASADTFFKVYAHVFDANARFSMVKPVPKLGDINTPDDDVNEFYNFWFSFKSWRDFAYLDKHKLETATSREEKRFYIRENQKEQAGKKKEEVARVRKLVEDAQKKDPRIARMRREEDERRNAGKRAKQDAAKAKLEAAEAEKKAAEEKARLEKEEKARADEEKKQQKELLKKARNAFGKACKAANLSDEATEKLRAELTLDDLAEMNHEFKNDPQSKKGIELFEQHMKCLAEEEHAKKTLSAEALAEQKFLARKAADEEAERANKSWTREEEAMLVKAIAKNPGGTVNRWEKITDMINSLPSSRTLKDVIRKAKLMECGQLGTQHVEQDQAYAIWLAKMEQKKTKDEQSKTQNAV